MTLPPVMAVHSGLVYPLDVLGVVRSRLRPPLSGSGWIDRRRLLSTLQEAAKAPILIVEADAGYGKTTVANIITANTRRMWYGLTTADRDPLVFLAHLMAASSDPSGRSLTDRDEGEMLKRTPQSWPQLLDDFLDGLDERSGIPNYLVLDDYHTVYRSPVDEVLVRLIECMPANLHVIVTTREHLELPGWIRARARGDIRDVGRELLAFDEVDTVAYFQTGFGISLTPSQALLLVEETEGWPIGLSLIGQRLRDRSQDPEALLAAMPEGRSEIFAFLGDQVFRDQPYGLRDFLLAISCLQILDPSVCAAVSATTQEQASKMLREINHRGVFCTDDGGGAYRLHHLFRDFLRAQLTTQQQQQFDSRAASYYRDLGERELAARHATRAGLLSQAAADIEAAQAQLLATGRHLTLLTVTDSLGDVLDSHPWLRIGRSHALRLSSRYSEAVDEARFAQGLLEQDAEGRNAALAAEVLVQLDTVQPGQAVFPLAAMSRLGPRLGIRAKTERIALIAENQVNAGRLRTAAHTLSRLAQMPQTYDVTAITQRLLVRRGELQRARAALEVARPPTKATIPHAHREDAALLAWIHGLLGHGERAESHAQRGVSLGADLRSPILSCVCLGRLGLAQICQNPREPIRAQESFLTALNVAEEISVPRFRAEPLIGLTVIAHRLGDDADTMRYGLDAVQTLEAAGDSYLTAMASLGIGVALAEQHNPDAETWLNRAHREATACGDSYIPLIADQWSGLLALEAGDQAEFAKHARTALKTTSALSLDDIWVTPSWLSIDPPDQRLQWLQAAHDLPEAGRYAGYLSARLNRPRRVWVPKSSVASEHPQRALHVQTLGQFAVLRDEKVLPPTAWTRRKAMEILWLLCANDRHSLSRDEVIDVLWEGEGGDTVDVRFRVALHALHLVLEPDRPSRSATRFVHTSTERLWLNTDEVEIDVDEFRRFARLAGQDLQDLSDDGLEAALAAIDLYQGPFLADAPFLDWLRPTRDTLAATFRDLVTTTAEKLIARADFSHAAALGRRALDEDPYLESAYRVIATAHLASGDRVAAGRVLEDCRRRLMDDLGVEPAWNLESLKIHVKAAER